MKKQQLKYLYLIALTIFSFSCNKPIVSENENIIAEVGSSVLYKEDIIREIPEELLLTTDSADIVSNYITQWIKQQLLVTEARKELNNKNQEIERQLKKYKDELTIHLYKQKKFEELNKSIINNTIVENYYNNNKNLFILKHPIIKVKYIIFPKELELPDNLIKNISSNDSTKIANAEDFIFKYAKKYDNFNNEWIYFNNIAEQSNIETNNISRYLKKNKYIEFTKDNDKHIIIFKAYMLENELAPLSFVENKIRSLITNERKLDFLREIKDSLYNDALKYNKFRLSNK